jgi:flagellar motor switch/type III secretory pathway protein FliN
MLEQRQQQGLRPVSMTPLTQWPLRRFGRAAAMAHARMLAQPAGPLRWSACADQQHRPAWRVHLAINDAPVRLHVRSRAFDDWAASTAGTDVPPALVSAGIAQSGAALWQALSTSLNAPLQFIEARSANALTVPDDALAWRLPALGWHGVLHAGTDAAWERVVAGLPDRAIASPSEGLMELPLQVRLRIGYSRLVGADFSRLRRHCVVLVDEAGAVRRHRDLVRLGVTVLAGPNRRVVARAVWVGNALYRAADFVVVNNGETPHALSGDEMNTSDSTSTAVAAAQDSAAAGVPGAMPPAAPPPVAAPRAGAPVRGAPAATAQTFQAPDLSEVEVEVRFEIGRMRWPLRQLVQWRVGQPVPLELELRDTPVTAWVHERCIAQGRLVVIGDRLGVKLDEVFAPISRPSKSSI